VSPAVATSHRPTPRTVAWVALLSAMATSALVLALWGRGQTFSVDEMAYAGRLSEQSLGHALLYPPHDKYLIAAPLLVFQAMLSTVGFDSYGPYEALAIALELLSAFLFFLLARRRVGNLLAVPPTVLLLFFGFGWTQMSTAITGLMALAAGLATLLVLTPESRRGNLAAAVLLTICLASHPSGLAFVAAAAVLIGLRPAPQRWRSAWVFLAPTALYAAWWMFLRPPATTSWETRVSTLASFVAQSWTASTAAASGLAGVIDGSAYDHTLGWLAAALLFALVVFGVATHARRLPPSFWAAGTAMLTLWVITGLPRGNPSVAFLQPVADVPRYLYPGTVLLLLVLVELAGAVRLPNWGAWLATGVVALGIAANLDYLHDSRAQARTLDQTVRAAFGATEIAAGTVRTTFQPFGPLYPSAGTYLDTVRAFGSPAYTPAEQADGSAQVRQRADSALFRAMRLGLAPISRPSSNNGEPPRVETALQGRSGTAAGCLKLRPTRSHGSFVGKPSVMLPSPVNGPATPALAEVTLPPGGVSIAADRLAEVGLRVGRFADSPAVPLEMLQAGRAASLAIPEDGVALPWKLVVYSRRAVTLCGLGAGDNA
jgi:hypothetical protein